MSDSLTEIMKEMRDRPRPTPEELALQKDRQWLLERSDKAQDEAIEGFIMAVLSREGSCSSHEMFDRFWSRYLSVVRKLINSGRLKLDDSFRLRL